MKAQLLSVAVGILIGSAATWLFTDDKTDDLALCKAENARYTNTVDGLKINGWTDERIDQYIETGCVPYLEWVKGGGK